MKEGIAGVTAMVYIRNEPIVKGLEEMSLWKKEGGKERMPEGVWNHKENTGDPMTLNCLFLW